LPKVASLDRIYRIDKIHYSFCWFEILKILYILSTLGLRAKPLEL
jgi:hypothetical protein